MLVAMMEVSTGYDTRQEGTFKSISKSLMGYLVALYLNILCISF